METIYDSNGVLLTVGARVIDPTTGEVGGTVTAVSDADGDTNSYGESIGIAPRVTVTYDDGVVEHWAASWNATGPWDDHRTDYTCDDVTVAVSVADRLEYLRGELRAERISYGDLAELQSLAAAIDPSDVELLEAAGVPEHDEHDETVAS